MQEESTATTSTLATEEAESIGPLPINALEAHGVASGDLTRFTKFWICFLIIYVQF